MKKINNHYIFKAKQKYKNSNYSIAKWIIFCEIMLRNNWEVYLYKSKSTVSKYVYIIKKDIKFKIRFSNHKASYQKEIEKDCDFYVGVGNNGVITTEQLIEKIIKNA